MDPPPPKRPPPKSIVDTKFNVSRLLFPKNKKLDMVKEAVVGDIMKSLSSGMTKKLRAEHSAEEKKKLNKEFWEFVKSLFDANEQFTAAQMGEVAKSVYDELKNKGLVALEYGLRGGNIHDALNWKDPLGEFRQTVGRKKLQPLAKEFVPPPPPRSYPRTLDAFKTEYPFLWTPYSKRARDLGVSEPNIINNRNRLIDVFLDKGGKSKFDVRVIREAVESGIRSLFSGTGGLYKDTLVPEWRKKTNKLKEELKDPKAAERIEKIVSLSPYEVYQKAIVDKFKYDKSVPRVPPNVVEDGWIEKIKRIYRGDEKLKGLGKMCGGARMEKQGEDYVIVEGLGDDMEVIQRFRTKKAALDYLNEESKRQQIARRAPPQAAPSEEPDAFDELDELHSQMRPTKRQKTGKGVTLSKKAFVKEHKNLLKVLKKGKKSDLLREAKSQSKELAKVMKGKGDEGSDEEMKRLTQEVSKVGFQASPSPPRARAPRRATPPPDVGLKRIVKKVGKKRKIEEVGRGKYKGGYEPPTTLGPKTHIIDQDTTGLPADVIANLPKSPAYRGMYIAEWKMKNVPGYAEKQRPFIERNEAIRQKSFDYLNSPEYKAVREKAEAFDVGNLFSDEDGKFEVKALPFPVQWLTPQQKAKIEEYQSTISQNIPSAMDIYQSQEFNAKQEAMEKEREKSPFNWINKILIGIGDVAANLPIMPSFFKDIYKTMAPPGSLYNPTQKRRTTPEEVLERRLAARQAELEAADTPEQRALIERQKVERGAEAKKYSDALAAEKAKVDALSGMGKCGGAKWKIEVGSPQHWAVYRNGVMVKQYRSKAKAEEAVQDQKVKEVEYIKKILMSNLPQAEKWRLMSIYGELGTSPVRKEGDYSAFARPTVELAAEHPKIKKRLAEQEEEDAPRPPKVKRSIYKPIDLDGRGRKCGGDLLSQLKREAAQSVTK
jgi:hypothetical protein